MQIELQMANWIENWIGNFKIESIVESNQIAKKGKKLIKLKISHWTESSVELIIKPNCKLKNIIELEMEKCYWIEDEKKTTKFNRIENGIESNWKSISNSYNFSVPTRSFTRFPSGIDESSECSV